jgi:UDP-GlcNAc3NAcA epimerase
LNAVLEGLCRIARRLPVVLPLHPRTRNRLAISAVDSSRLAALRIVEPLGYLDMAQATRHSRLVVTDSGGLQKEAFFHRVPCVTLRSETEWVETVALGWNVVVPPDSADDVVREVEASLSRPLPPEPDVDPYGGGVAAQRIADHIANVASSFRKVPAPTAALSSDWMEIASR